jgi:hypothetical protein
MDSAMMARRNKALKAREADRAVADKIRAMTFTFPDGRKFVDADTADRTQPTTPRFSWAGKAVGSHR